MPRCLAKKGYDEPVTIEQAGDDRIGTTTDVGQQFFMIFVFGMIMNLLTAVWLIISFCLTSKSRFLIKKMNVFLLCVSIVFVSFASVQRYCHAGMVCSGAYIGENVRNEVDRYDKEYLYVEGMYLKVWTTINWCRIGI